MVLYSHSMLCCPQATSGSCVGNSLLQSGVVSIFVAGSCVKLSKNIYKFCPIWNSRREKLAPLGQTLHLVVNYPTKIARV